MFAEALKQPIFTRSSTSSQVGGLNMYQRLQSSLGTTAIHGKNSALTLSAFYCGIEVICNDFAKLPKGVFQKTPDGEGRQEIQHPVKHLINTRPNQYMIAFQFDKVMILDAILRGNGYAIKENNKNTAQITALQYVDQDKTPVEVVKSNNKLYYIIDGQTYSSEDVIHIPGFSYNGIVGIGVVKHAARSLGIAMSSEEFAHDYYDGKGVGTGVLTTTKSMKDEAKTRYSAALSQMFGQKSKWVVPIIDEASNFEHIKVTPQEAQFLLSSEQGINEVARWLNINPSKLKHNKDINNSISESLERQHVNDSVLPWAIKAQQEYNAKLFSETEKLARIYTKFNIQSLLSADMSAQADYWFKLILIGVLDRNEVRALIERNPKDGLSDPLTPANAQVMQQILLKLEEQEKNLES
jgi:HK97 family phage portal protein